MLTYVYLNPYTNIESFEDIGVTLKELDKAFSYAKFSSKKDNKKFNYIFWNAYGSGFINNNPIPNDLDFSIGIDLGKYVYNGNNSEEIAADLIDKINSFNRAFNFYINTTPNSKIYATQTPFNLINKQRTYYNNNVKNISENLEKALLGQSYIHTTHKNLEGVKLEVPYIMNSSEILIEDNNATMLYSDIVSYNKIMPRYMREISIIPEFFVHINYKGEDKLIELVQEAFLGERLQLSRRFFASGVFVHNKSVSFLKNLNYIENNDDYIYYRMYVFRRHLQEMNNILVMNDRPLKLLKRLKQTADIISPALDDETYTEINEFVYENLNQNKIKLLNEYSNICINILNILDSPSLYIRLQNSGKTDIMYKTLDVVIQSLEADKAIDEKTLKLLKDFRENELKKELSYNEIPTYRENLIEKYGIVSDAIASCVLNSDERKEKIEKYISIFNQIYTEAGFHKVSLYWLNSNTIGILEDDFTKNIKDFREFAKDNKLIDVNYKLIKSSEIPNLKIRYDIYARYNSTDSENKAYKNLQDKLLQDKKNFNIKKKVVFIR